MHPECTVVQPNFLATEAHEIQGRREAACEYAKTGEVDLFKIPQGDENLSGPLPVCLKTA